MACNAAHAFQADIEAAVSVPFVIRETRRKFQHTLSEVTIWEKLD